jgi:eukaryotic-like serine/threonine-protein kinase
MAAPGMSVKSHPVLGPIEKYLATILGPMADVMVQRAASKAKDNEELFALLASSLALPKDRQAFLARKDTFFRGVPQPHPERESSTTGSAARHPIPSRSAELTPSAISHASDLLARYLGPVSRIVTERAASQADSLRSLYLILAGHLKEGAERSSFLHEAGFPESWLHDKDSSA